MRKILYFASAVIVLVLAGCNKQTGAGGGTYSPGTVLASVNLKTEAAVVREDKIIVSADASAIATALRISKAELLKDASDGKFSIGGTSVTSIPETQFTKFKTVGQGTGDKFFTFEVVPDITMADTTKVLTGTQEINYSDNLKNSWTFKFNWAVTVTKEQAVAKVTETKFDASSPLDGVAITASAKAVTKDYSALEISLPADLYSAFKKLAGSDLLAGAILNKQVTLYASSKDQKTTETVIANPVGNKYYFSKDGSFSSVAGDVSLGLKYDTAKFKDVTLLLNVTPDATAVKDEIVCTYIMGMGTYKIPVKVTVNIVKSL